MATSLVRAGMSVAKSVIPTACTGLLNLHTDRSWVTYTNNTHVTSVTHTDTDACDLAKRPHGALSVAADPKFIPRGPSSSTTDSGTDYISLSDSLHRTDWLTLRPSHTPSHTHTHTHTHWHTHTHTHTEWHTHTLAWHIDYDTVTHRVTDTGPDAWCSPSVRPRHVGYSVAVIQTSVRRVLALVKLLAGIFWLFKLNAVWVKKLPN